MPYPKDIRRYTEKWLETFDWFEAHPHEDFVLECETEKRAHSLRFEFYRARETMRKDKELAKYYLNTDRREAVINGMSIVFRYKETTPIADLLQRNLEANDKRLEGK